jgi:hypothetical protein
MPERTVEEVREEIAVERERLADELDALHGELRWLVLVPFLAAGGVAIAVLARGKARKSGMGLIWKFL